MRTESIHTAELTVNQMQRRLILIKVLPTFVVYAGSIQQATPSLIPKMYFVLLSITSVSWLQTPSFNANMQYVLLSTIGYLLATHIVFSTTSNAYY